MLRVLAGAEPWVRSSSASALPTCAQPAPPAARSGFEAPGCTRKQPWPTPNARRPALRRWGPWQFPCTVTWMGGRPRALKRQTRRARWCRPSASARGCCKPRSRTWARRRCRRGTPPPPTRRIQRGFPYSPRPTIPRAVSRRRRRRCCAARVPWQRATAAWARRSWRWTCCGLRRHERGSSVAWARCTPRRSQQKWAPTRAPSRGGRGRERGG